MGDEDKEGMLVGSDPLVGTIFARKYEILSVVGEGGMGVVYKACQRLMKKVVAIKVLHPQLVKGPALKRFQQEAQATSRLSHRNLIAVHDFGITDDGQPYLVMDYLEGTSLADIIKEQGCLSVERLLNVAMQACDALAHAHSMGIVHRDLKPSNIMLVQTKEEFDLVKVVDFGIAKIIAQEGDDLQKLTQTGELFGSPFYMSPEQCLGQALDCRSDIYSFGCLLYEALTGTPPYKGGNVYETIYKHLNEMPASLVIPGCDRAVVERFDALIFKSMEKSREKRYQSMTELKLDLETILRQLTGGWKLWISISGTAMRIVRHARRLAASHPRAAMAVVVMLTTIVVASAVPPLYVVLTERGPSDQEMPFEEPAPEIEPKPADFEDKQREVDRVLAVVRRRPDPTHKILLETLNKVAERYLKLGEWKRAGTLYQEVYEILVKQSGEETLSMADAYQHLAYCNLQQGLLANATAFYVKAVTIRTQMSDEEEKSQLAGLLSKLGDIYLLQGMLDPAANEYVQSLRVWEGREYNSQPSRAMAVLSAPVAIAVGRLADTFQWKGNYAEAEMYYRQALCYWELLKENPLQQNLAICRTRLASTLYKENKLQEADAMYELALADMKKTTGDMHPYVGRVLQDYADVLWKEKAWSEFLHCKFEAAKILSKRAK